MPYRILLSGISRKYFLSAVSAIIILLSSSTVAAPSVESYGRLPLLQYVDLSPDGKHLAMILTDRDTTALQILNLETGKTEHLLAPPDDNIFRGVSWAEDDKAMYYISTTLRPRDTLPDSSLYAITRAPALVEYWRVGVLNVVTGDAQIMLENAKSWANSAITNLIAPIEGDPGYGRLITWGNILDPLLPAELTVYRVNLTTGRGSPVASGDSDTLSILLDESGDMAARVDAKTNSNKWRLYGYKDGSAKKVLEGVSEVGAPIAAAGLLPDDRIVIADRLKKGPREMAYAVDVESEEVNTLYDVNPFDIGWVIKDPWTRRVLGVSWTEDFPVQKFFNDELQSLQEEISNEFSSGYVRIMSWSRDRRRYVLYGEHADDAGAFYLYEPEGEVLRRIGQRYPDLSGEAELGIRQAISYKASDGVSVPAYLTLPATDAEEKLPLVVLVHGGPHSRDTFTFDWWASFLASRGYAVLQANYRGSTGYGYEWFDAGRGQWGDGVMQTDVLDGVDALVRSGIVDKERICIMGGSYGGYAALAGATLTPERFACAISVNGVSDVIRMLDEAEKLTGRKSISSDWWRLSIGDRRKDRKQLIAISPARNAEKASAPILLIHGLEDSVVPFKQSADMADALKAAGGKVEFVRLEGDDHWLSTAATRTQMLRAAERFLDEQIGAGAGR